MTVSVSPDLMSTENVSLMLNCGLVSVMRCEPAASLRWVCGVCRPVSLPSTRMLVHGLEPSRSQPSDDDDDAAAGADDLSGDLASGALSGVFSAAGLSAAATFFGFSSSGSVRSGCFAFLG